MASGTINIRPLNEVFLAKDKYWRGTVKNFLKEGVGAIEVDLGGVRYDMTTLFTKVLKPLDIMHSVTQIVLIRTNDETGYQAKCLSDYFADATGRSKAVSFDAYLDALIASFGFRSFERSLFFGEQANQLSLDALPSL